MPSPWDRISADLEDFGRRQPLAVMGLGGVAGFVASRFIKAPSPERYEGRAPQRAGGAADGLAATGRRAHEFRRTALRR